MTRDGSMKISELAEKLRKADEYRRATDGAQRMVDVFIAREQARIQAACVWPLGFYSSSHYNFDNYECFIGTQWSEQ